jgi:hypothetical protein
VISAPRARSLAALGALLLLGTFTYWPYLDTGFVGPDVLPSIEAARISSWADLAGPWTRPFMDNSRFAQDVALIYRPVVWLTFSVDYLVYGLEPRGYHATNTLFFLAAVGGIYVFLRSLRFSVAASFLGAALYALHPAMVQTVPGLARRHDLVAASALIASIVCLVKSENQGRGRTKWLAASVALFLVALLGKEPAFAALPLVIPTLLAIRAASSGDLRVEWRKLLQTMAPFLIVAVVFFAVRWLALGSMGGYRGALLTFFDVDAYLRALGQYVAFFLFGLTDVRFDQSRLPWFALLAFAGWCALVGWAMSLRSRVMFALGLTWVVTFAVFFTSLKTIAGPWYLAYPLIGAALMLASVGDDALPQLVASLNRPPGLHMTAVVRLLGRVLALAGVTVYAAGALALSALFTDYSVWRDGWRLTQPYLTAVARCASEDDGRQISATVIPRSIAYLGPRIDFMSVSLVERYSLEAWLKLVRPSHRGGLRTDSYVDFNVAPVAFDVACENGDVVGVRPPALP